MEHHAGILQQRIQIAPFGSGRDQPGERVRGEQQEQQEADADQAHHRQHARGQRVGKIARKDRYGAAPAGEHQGPQQQRSFVQAPAGLDAVVQWQFRVRVGGDVLHRKVVGCERPCEARERDCDQHELHPRRRPCQRHHPLAVERGAQHRHDALRGGDQQRQDQREVTELGDHLSVFVSCRLGIVIPFLALSIAACACGGM